MTRLFAINSGWMAGGRRRQMKGQRSLIPPESHACKRYKQRKEDGNHENQENQWIADVSRLINLPSNLDYFTAKTPRRQEKRFAHFTGFSWASADTFRRSLFHARSRDGRVYQILKGIERARTGSDC